MIRCLTPAGIEVDDMTIEQLPPVRTGSGVHLASELTSTAGSRGSRPLVFLHATGFSRGVWRPVARQLADTAPGIALDLRGHGDSSKPRPPYRWSLFAEDVAAYVEQLHAGQVVLCGHSVGGATAVQVAALIPDRVAALVLVEPVLMPPREGAQPARGAGQSGLLTATLRRQHSWPGQALAEQHLAARSPYRYWDREVLAGYFATGLTRTGDGRCTLSCPPEIEAAIYTEAPASQAWSRLPEISCPVRILRAAGSQGMPSTASPLIAQVTRDGVDRLAGGPSGHFVPMEQPGLVAAFVREMLTGLPGAR
jgi:pimeloyl-ACP methyl ester carboxylesterase